MMPTRAQLRATARTDLEKAIAAHGGPAAVAKRLGWRLPYKASAPDLPVLAMLLDLGLRGVREKRGSQLGLSLVLVVHDGCPGL